MSATITVNPFRCCMWSFHDRLEQHIDEQSCRAEIESIRKNGQLVPALGRPLPQGSEYDYELIYGARRLFVARYLNKPLLIEVRSVTDHEGIVAMDIENRHRRDISAYERGASYLRWLRTGLFKSQEELSRALNVSASQVCRLLKVAMLPAVVVAAFETPQNIHETWALALSVALDDPDRRSLICSRARAIGCLQSRPPAKDVFRDLLSAGPKGRRVTAKRRDEVVSGGDGKPLFRVRHRLRTVDLMFSVDNISQNELKKVVAAAAVVLQRERLEEADQNRLTTQSTAPVIAQE